VVGRIAAQAPPKVSKSRDRIISAATILLDRGGPSAVTLRDVARAVGLTHTAAYKHFVDKDELLVAVAERELARQAKLKQGSSEASTLQLLLSMHTDWARRYPERFKLVFFHWAVPPESIKNQIARAHALVLSAVKASQADGELPSADPDA